MAERIYYMDSRYFIYGLLDCPFCVKAIEELSERGLECCFFDLADDEDFLVDTKSFYNHKTVPIILRNNKETGHTKLIGGCDDLLELLSD